MVWEALLMNTPPTRTIFFEFFMRTYPYFKLFFKNRAGDRQRPWSPGPVSEYI